VVHVQVRTRPALRTADADSFSTHRLAPLVFSPRRRFDPDTVNLPPPSVSSGLYGVRYQWGKEMCRYAQGSLEGSPVGQECLDDGCGWIPLLPGWGRRVRVLAGEGSPDDLSLERVRSLVRRRRRRVGRPGRCLDMRFSFQRRGADRGRYYVRQGCRGHGLDSTSLLERSWSGRWAVVL